MIPEETIFAHLSIRDWIRLRVVPHFSSGIVERTKRERAWKSTHARKGDTRRGERKKCRLFSRGVIFTRARVSLALLSLRKNGGLLVAYDWMRGYFFLLGFLSLSSSKLIAVQPSNMLTASHVEYPMLPGKPTYESTADTQQSQGET